MSKTQKFAKMKEKPQKCLLKRWALFCTLFLKGPFSTVFARPKRKNKGTLTDFRSKNDENFGFCLFYFGHFSTKERNICLFLFVLSNFLFLIKKPFISRILSGISELKVESVSDPFFALKARFFSWTFFLHDFPHF